jgi:SAM-dependent methyltransferase
MNAHDPEDLQRIYGARFSTNLEYRKKVWSVLVADWFGRYVRTPDASRFLSKEITFLLQDCSARWPLPDASLDVVFTSNFLEHLPDKGAVGRTLDEIRRCLRPGGRVVAMGPNVKYLPGEYWDFWDHHVPLTEASIKEALMTRGFSVDTCLGQFLPYTMATGRQYPVAFLSTYLKLPFVWRIFGRQFLVVGTRPS